MKKACATDPRASESVRVAGSLNFKQKYAPNFPCVAITHAAPGLMASRDQLQELGLVAAPDIIPAPRGVPLRGSRGRSWPDYQRCLAGARLNSDGTGPDRSGADYMWSKWAIQRGWSVEEVAAQLMELSTKAQEKKHGKPYALKTAQQAAVAAERDEVGQGRGRKGKAAEPLSSDGGGAG